MSTLEEFENAPVGATATGPDGRRAIKTTGGIWYTTNGIFLYNEEIVDYVLDPAPPSSAREALDLAWNLAHPIREGQMIPAGTAYLLKHGGGHPSTMRRGIGSIASARDEKVARTLDPLPGPEPDWLDAPAVIAAHAYRDDQVLWENCDGIFVNATLGEADWHELRDVTPLWPRQETDA